MAVLDVATARLGPVSARARIERVAQLLHSLQDTLGYDERRAFVERYARETGLTLTALDDFAREVRAEEQRIQRTRERSRDKRCLVESTEYYVRRGLRRRVFARREITPEEIAFFGGIGKSLGEMAARGARVVKDEGRNECFVVERGGTARFVKRVRASSFFGALVDAVRGSRGRRAWRAAHALTRRGIATPRAFALVEEGFLVPMRSTLIVEHLADANNLGEVAREIGARLPRRAERARFIESLGRAVAALHNEDVDHDDLATKNFLVRLGPEPQVSVIDLDAVRGWHAPLARERILRALMQLDDAPRAVSRADRMRFLVAYEKATKMRYTREDLAEVRRLLKERFARSKRDFAKSGPR
jgi:tRNA A-37 threonylcarbamoyl transferase component Bud32